MDLKPVIEALTAGASDEILRLAALELGAALARNSSTDDELRVLDAQLTLVNPKSPTQQGMRNAIRAVLAGAIQARMEEDE